MSSPALSREHLGLLLGFVGMATFGGTLAAAVVATVAISTRTRSRPTPFAQG